jgi:MFS family permease
MSKAISLFKPTATFPAQRIYRVAVCVFFFLQGLTFASWASRIPDIKNNLHLSDAGLGGVLLCLPIGQITAMALSGFLVSRFGSRYTLPVGATLYPIALVALGAATSVLQLSIALYFFGMSANLCNISVNTQGVGVERLYRRSILASFHGVWSLAGFTGGLISTVMVANNITPFYHFCIIWSCAFVLMLTAQSFLLPRDAGSDSKRPIFVKPDKAIFRLGMIAFASMVCEGAMFDWSGVYFEKVVAAPKDLIRLGYIAFMCTMAGGRFAADWLITRCGVRRMLQAAGLIILTGLLLAVLMPYIVSATIGFLLVGLGVSSVVPMAYSLAGRSTTMRPGVALAAVSSVGFLGFLMGPPVIGFIAQAAGLQWSFSLIAVLGLGTTLLSGKIKT